MLINDTRRETLQGREYLVADVTAAKQMRLNGGLVPSDEWAKSVHQWEAVPLPVGHPIDQNGEYVSARIPEVLDQVVVGNFHNVYHDPSDTTLRGELWVDVERAEDVGEYGDQIIDAIENGEQLEVSTAYTADYGQPGEYNGEWHDEVRTNLKPDHLALLPSDLGPGKCSGSDGCGTNPSGDPAEGVTNAASSRDPDLTPANADALAADTPRAGMVLNTAAVETDVATVEVNQVANVLSEARAPEYDGTESQSWGDIPADTLSHYTENLDIEGESWADLSQSERSEIASHTLLGDPDADSIANGIFFPVVNAATSDLNEGALEAVISGRGEAADISESAKDSAQSRARSLLEDEFDRDLDDNEENAACCAACAGHETHDMTNNAPGDEDPQTLFQKLMASVGYPVANDGTDGGSPLVNLESGDTVRWMEDDERHYGTVADTLDGSPDGMVLVEERVPMPEGDGPNWQEDDQTHRITTSDLEVLEGLPNAIDVANGDVGSDTDSGPDPDSDPDADPDADADVNNGGADPDKNSDTDTDTMSDHDIEELANSTSFSVEQLQNFNDGQLEDVAALANAGTEGDDPEDDPDGTDTDADTDIDGNADEIVNRLESVVDDRVSDLEENVDDRFAEFEDRLDTVEANTGPDREALKDDITSNSDAYTEEDLEEMNDSLLEKTHNAVVPDEPAANAAGQGQSPMGGRSGTDFSALDVNTAEEELEINDEDLPSPGTSSAAKGGD